MAGAILPNFMPETEKIYHDFAHELKWFIHSRVRDKSITDDVL